MKRFTTLLLILSVLFLSGCDFFGNKLSPPVNFITEELIENVDSLDEIIAYLSDNFVISGKVKLKDLTAWEQLSDFYKDNPEILAKRGIHSMKIKHITRKGVIEAELIPQYEMFMNILIAYETGEVSHLSEEEKQVYEEAKRIIAEEMSGSNIFDKTLSIHEYLISNMEYEHEYEENESAFNIYGALVQGKAVCKGYAHSYKMLLHMAGIESVIVIGEAGGENHAWNLVNYGSDGFNDEWYHVDPTWNDQGEIETHKFFNVNDGILDDTHKWNDSSYPTANGTKYNYFRYKGFMASSVAAIESNFVSVFNSNSNDNIFLEIICSFDVTTYDLSFMNNYVDGSKAMFSIVDYGDDRLLTIIYNEDVENEEEENEEEYEEYAEYAGQ